MTNELTFAGMAAGASAYITGKFFYSTLETMADHREIQSKLEEGQELEKEDVLFLEDSVRTVEEYMEQSSIDFIKKFLGKPEEIGEAWGHIISANEENGYDGEFQYEVPGYGDDEVKQLLENQETGKS